MQFLTDSRMGLSGAPAFSWLPPPRARCSHGGLTEIRSYFLPMKTILTVTLLACVLSMGACSRSEKPGATQTTPNPNLKSDAERLQQATAKAAEERKRAESASAPSATP